MRDQTHKWLQYARENLESARLLVANRCLNACLQNAQQAVEKGLKAVFIERSLLFKKTHSVRDLRAALLKQDCHINLTEEEADLLDAIYLPSRYPLGKMPCRISSLTRRFAVGA